LIKTISASCHCGAIQLEINKPPETLTECNCSICRRYGVLWAYYLPKNVQVAASPGADEAYSWGPRSIEFHRCKVCGCVTHWRAVAADATRMGINARLMDPEILRPVRIRKLDGASTGTYFR
jgi:hypothetical protein